MVQGSGTTTQKNAGSLVWDLDDYFVVDVRLSEVDGRTVVSAVHIHPHDYGDLPVNGLSSKLLRSVHLDEALESAMEGVLDQEAPEVAAELVGREIARRRGQERSEDFYAAIAELYLLAIRTAPRRPIVQVSEFLKLNGLDASTEQVRSWTNLARRRGLITNGTPGSAGAEATDNLIRWRKAQLKKR
jgi:hypothetical protein